MNILQHLLKICLATTLFWSCTSSDDNIPYTPPETTSDSTEVMPSKYLALGDSYTIGQSVAEADRFPVQLIQRLEAENIPMDPAVIIAKTGWRTDDLAGAIDVADLKDTFDLVSLLIGVNNQFQGRSIDEYEIEFAELLNTAIDQAGGKKESVFVLSIPDYAFTPFGQSRPNSSSISEEIDAFNKINKTITEDLGIAYFDITPISRQGLLNEALVAEDGLHPSGTMYSFWVDEMIEQAKVVLGP